MTEGTGTKVTEGTGTKVTEATDLHRETKKRSCICGQSSESAASKGGDGEQRRNGLNAKLAKIAKQATGTVPLGAPSCGYGSTVGLPSRPADAAGSDRRANRTKTFV